MPFNDMVGALSQGAVDVAFLVQPFITIVDEKGIGVGIGDLWELFPGHMTNNLFYSDALIRNRPTVGEKFMLGFLKGQRYFYDAVVKKKESVDSIVDIVAKYSRSWSRDTGRSHLVCVRRTRIVHLRETVSGKLQ